MRVDQAGPGCYNNPTNPHLSACVARVITRNLRSVSTTFSSVFPLILTNSTLLGTSGLESGLGEVEMFHQWSLECIACLPSYPDNNITERATQ